MEDVELYGKITSHKAKQLIIDLFNKINAGKPYVMKTLTTIYKNDDIFKGNLRYPIDAPYRDFYRELTEKYVVDHNLDNIFFEKGEAKTGEYYFEYTYHSESSSFLIHNSPKQLKDELSKSYVPMLYSMVSGCKIDWEQAKSKTTFNKKNSSKATKVLLVFGKDTLKTLEFSWLATFELKTSKDATTKKIISEIRKQEPEIVNFTQGVLFGELDGQIINFLQAQRQFEHTKTLIKDHKHTLKNFGFKGALNALYHKVKNDHETLKIYKYVENLELLRDYTTDILYNFGDLPGSLLLKENGINSFTEILELIHSATIEHQTKAIYYEPKVKEHSLNIIDDVDLPNVFTVLLNLYSNSRNHGKGDYKIELHISDNEGLTVVFTNKGEMPKSYVDYFLETKSVLKDDGAEGIKFIKDALNKLIHIQRSCVTNNDSTNITLIVNLKT